jgi:alkanesulfonate monooxygenase SsuD/methylene tetrahydromethanopterin reductase-like flavin-dependent oxidoreductase (luciferase family)
MDRTFAMFGVPSLDQMGREHVELDVSDLPPPPPAIAAASAAPLRITARQGDETHTRTTTVGQAYQALPEDARAQFEEQVRTSISDDHSIHFRDFTVTSPIGSISISSN